MRIGIYGGTFDPIHCGHLALAEDARCYLALDTILFVTAGQPWMKENTKVTGASHRLAMVELAVQERPHFEMTNMEVKRTGPTYTLETMRELHEKYGPRAELFLLLGLDAAGDLSRWHQPDELVKLCQIVVMNRYGAAPLAKLDLESQIPGSCGRIKILDIRMVDISSTEIRRRVAQGSGIGDSVPEKVEKYISDHHLYRSGGGL